MKFSSRIEMEIEESEIEAFLMPVRKAVEVAEAYFAAKDKRARDHNENLIRMVPLFMSIFKDMMPKTTAEPEINETKHCEWEGEEIENVGDNCEYCAAKFEPDSHTHFCKNSVRCMVCYTLLHRAAMYKTSENAPWNPGSIDFMQTRARCEVAMPLCEACVKAKE